METLANIYELRHLDGGTSLTIYDKISEVNIGKYTSMNKANMVLANLVNGAAFLGWTPSFFSYSYERKHGKA